MSEPSPVVICLFPGDLGHAEAIARAVGGRVDLRGRDFAEPSRHIPDVFLGGRAVIGLCATAILIRLIAPYLKDKNSEPPVLAVAPDGGLIIPLLGGHRGANTLARRIANDCGGTAAVTTAGDVRIGVALDDPPAGWRLANPEEAKPVMAALLAGAPARLSGDADWLAPLGALANVRSGRGSSEATAVLAVEGLEPLIWRRTAYALGVGCARHCQPPELISLVMRSLAEAGIAHEEIASLHSIDLKADEAAIHALAAHLDIPATFFSAARLEAEKSRLAKPSDAVFAEVGCHGVAEGSALAAAGPDGILTIAKQKSEHATCALARIGKSPEHGQTRGLLAVVGIGPGDTDWRTPEATRLIAEADEVVGYSLYLDLLGAGLRGKVRRSFQLGQEEARCRYALEAAGQGRRVTLVCSGDGGIYAMGALVMELLDRPEAHGGVTAAARRVEVVHAPGISALQAASARAGAMLGHDFCAISLSDLLTPAETIRRRLRAAAEGDFVVALYNPVSRQRRALLDDARRILLGHRAGDTPVLLAANLGRSDERLALRRLDRLSADEVDMLTIVMVGASTSRVLDSGDGTAGISGQWIYTPRGYATKLDEVLP